MRVVIFEDEYLSTQRLTQLLLQQAEPVEVVGEAQSVEEALTVLDSEPDPDLIFCDIQLADGPSFDLFSQRSVTQPVIFTTAYDQYALRAFEVNAVDYLLKPIDPDKLNRALEKYRQFNPQTVEKLDHQLVNRLVNELTPKAYKHRFLVKMGARFQFKSVNEVAYFYAEGKTVWLVDNVRGQKFLIDASLEKLEQELLNPQHFFRINRSVIIHLNALTEIKNYPNSRLKVSFQVPTEQDIVVARGRVSAFKATLDT
ncbi:MAG TPA: DNA-binding response regulator [Cytophagales bacterium]|nr:DNA-binding response regulator [Cytophagales bacterium]HAA23177.1 DNA-binding response regulator [Cytophagales bacterium]HAP59082.1 DNA-binding response regulator [Cytophagales bacterium]